MAQETTKTVTLGLVGVGRIGVMHARNIAAIAPQFAERGVDLQLKLTDVAEDHARAVAAQVGAEFVPGGVLPPRDVELRADLAQRQGRTTGPRGRGRGVGHRGQDQLVRRAPINQAEAIARGAAAILTDRVEALALPAERRDRERATLTHFAPPVTRSGESPEEHP